MEAWRPQQLTAAQREERRIAAARRFAALRAGRVSQVAVAREFGVSPAAIAQWYARWQRGGRAALQARPHPGRPPQLTERQWARLGTLLRRGAIAAGFPTERWTLVRIARLIQRTFGITYHPRSLGPALHAHGFTVQRPVPRAAERDEDLIHAWLVHDWPAVKRGLVARGTPLPAWTRRVTRFGPA